MRRVSSAADRLTRAASSPRAAAFPSSVGKVTAIPAAGRPAWSWTAAATDANPGVTSPSSVAEPDRRTSRGGPPILPGG